jgi:hypothetical protein
MLYSFTDKTITTRINIKRKLQYLLNPYLNQRQHSYSKP